MNYGKTVATTGSANCEVVPVQITIPAIIDQIEQLAAGLRNSCGMVADNLRGSEPQPGEVCKAPAPSTILDRLFTVRGLLEEATYGQRRVTETLAL